MLEVRSELLENGYRLNIFRRKEGLLRRKATFEPIQSWGEAVAGLNPLAAAVIDELEQAGKLISSGSGGKVLGFAAAAELQNSDAEALNLLPPFPYQLDIESLGALGSNSFKIQYHVSQGGIGVPGTFSEGVFTAGEKQYRISGLLFSILAAIEGLNTETRSEGRIEKFAALRLLLPDDTTNTNIFSEKYLLRIRIAHVTAIGLKPSITDGNVSFDPIPMRRTDPEDYDAGAELAITPATSNKFAREFRGQRNVNSTYALESGQYLYIDPSVRIALRVVKQKQNAPLEERMAFLMSPARAITDAYRESGVEEKEMPIGDTIFFETSEYSERITGIGEWIPPQLNYLEEGQNNWLPERFSVVLSGKLVTGKPDDVPGWIEKVKTALASNKEEVKLGDVSISTNTPGLLTTLQRLQPPEAKPTAERDKSDKPADEFASPRKNVSDKE